MAFEIGNKYAQQWNLENAKPRFEDALKYAVENDDCLCLQDAIFQTGIPSRTFYYLADNEPVLQIIKDDIHEAIIRRVNCLALRDHAPASPAIWRMKQLGEKDQQFIDQHNTGTINQNISVTSKEDIEEIENLKDKFENEDCE